MLQQPHLRLVEDLPGPEIGAGMDTLFGDGLQSSPEIAKPDEVNVYMHSIDIDDPENQIVDLIHKKSPLIVREVVPADRDAETELTGTIVIMHGLTQLSDKGPSAALHEILALKHPDKRVLAIETDGMGEYSDGLSLCKPGELASYTLEEMAARRLEFFRRVGSEENPISLVGTSMGSVLEIMALKMAKEREIKLHIKNVIFNDSAVIKEQGVGRIRKMAEFPLHMAVTLPWQLAKTSIRQKPEMLRIGLGALRGIGAKDLLAMGRQTYDLLFGSDHPDADEIAETLAHYPETHFTFLSGILDPLRDASMYSKFKRESLENAPFQDHIHVGRDPYAGHGRSVDSKAAAHAINRVLEKGYAPAA